MASNPKQEQKKGWSIGTFWKKSASNQATPQKEGAPKENNALPMKNISKNLEKFGSYAMNLAKEIKTNVQSQMTGIAFGDPTWNDQNYDYRHHNQGPNQDSDDEEFDDEEQEGEYDEEYDEEEGGHGREEGEEQEDDDEGSEEEDDGYEEEEGSLEDEDEEEEETKAQTAEPERSSMDDFAIDDDESPPIQHPNPDAAEAPEEKKHKEPRKKKSKKKSNRKRLAIGIKCIETKKTKGKGKSIANAQAGTVNREEQMSEDLVLEDVYINRNYVLGDLFTDFHQFYFKGDYLDYEPDEFFKASLASEKTGITNMLFQETRYLSVQDNILYITELETVEDYKLALVQESYPLSRLVKFERVDKKKRVVIGFYTDESNSQNPQREVTFEIKNYSKFLKVMGQSLSTVNSSFHLLSFNIE